MEFRKLVLAGVVTGSLVACGGSGGGSENSGASGSAPVDTAPSYNGNRNAAVLSSSNTSELAGAAIKAIKYAEAEDSRSDMPNVPESTSSNIGTARSLRESPAHYETHQTETYPGSCGGNMVVSGTNTVVTVNFNDYCDSGVEVDGTYTVTSTTVGAVTTLVLSYQNVTIQDSDTSVVSSGTFTTIQNTQSGAIEYKLDLTLVVDGEKIRLVESERCDAQFNCTSVATYSVDGEIYEAENIEFKSTVNGSNVSARIYDADEGYFEMEAENITYCGNGNIKTGSITLSDDSSNQIDVTFDGDCENMTVTADGVAETVTQ